MPIHDELGKRMKIYEAVPKIKLVRRMPVAIRIDGKAFHTFTRGFDKPFDKVLIKSMQETTKYLCENIQGCVLGYTQSDEITLILVDYKTLETDAWFDYEVQKLCSIAASMTTMKFNKVFRQNVLGVYYYDHYGLISPDVAPSIANAYEKAKRMGAMFDARCFNIPKEEVTNLIYWRQLDATRNSIQMVGQANFSHKELQNKSCNDIQNMLLTERDINWNDFPVYLKRGTACIKNDEGKWFIDEEMPILKNEGRDYVEKLIMLT